jgi:hypothetical protein
MSTFRSLFVGCLGIALLGCFSPLKPDESTVGARPTPSPLNHSGQAGPNTTPSQQTNVPEPVFPTRGPNPAWQIQPISPCINIGQNVEVRGTGGFQGNEVEIWLQLNQASAKIPDTDAIKIGTAPISLEGTFAYSFLLEETMLSEQGDKSINLKRGTRYDLFLVYDEGSKINSRYLEICTN